MSVSSHDRCAGDTLVFSRLDIIRFMALTALSITDCCIRSTFPLQLSFSARSWSPRASARRHFHMIETSAMLRGLLSILAARCVQDSGRMTVLHCIYANCSSLCSMPLTSYIAIFTAIFMCQLGDTRQLIRTSRSRRLRISKYHEQVTENMLEVYVVRGDMG